jgi:hypothetical protein
LGRENGWAGGLIFVSLLTSDVVTLHEIGARLEPVFCPIGLHARKNSDKRPFLTTYTDTALANLHKKICALINIKNEQNKSLQSSMAIPISV